MLASARLIEPSCSGLSRDAIGRWSLSLFDFLGLNNWALDIKWAHNDNNK